MKTYTITQVRQLLNVDNKTLARWLDRAGITPQGSEHDERVKRISQEQLELLASIHERPIGALPLEKEVHPTVRALERKVTDQAERIERLERELEFEDDLSDRVDRLAEQVKQLDRQIQELGQRTMPKKQRAVSTATTEERNATRATTAPNKAIPAQDDSQQTEELPDDLVSATSFAKQHAVPESTLNKAIATERIPVVKGTWKAGRATVKKALNKAGRQRFYELYSHNERFTPCDECPHTPL